MEKYNRLNIVEEKRKTRNEMRKRMRYVKAQLEHYSSNELKAKVTIYKRVHV